MRKFIAGLILGVCITSIPMTLAISGLFSDVPANQWYTNAVLNLSSKGIIHGYPNGTFEPNNNVNRAELAVMLDRLLKYLEGGTFVGDGFSFTYPSGYIQDEKGLWTKEGYENHLNPPEGCSICDLPFFEIASENQVNQSLDDYIIQDFELPGSTLKEMSEVTGIEVSQEIIGSNHFTKLMVSDLHEVIAYYTKKGDHVVSFKIYSTQNDNAQLHDILSTLQMN